MARYSVIDSEAFDPANEIVRSGFDTEFEALEYIKNYLGQPGRFYAHSYETFGDY